ncbi:hypothetical protein D1B31_18165 [Neobacillus notoginsengisoli]|uniref:Uncharacterized protein n=1 Tax=Neobacillus notoginsengisoli TaxID=1578198 RepID=A0A417YPT8_9BACI|nr:hypothetical protein [Neobacillus notoginsengisoli]RHW36014.1 hypothetical protein D1B31_18165 [Neobacillus notoginsengisoli]
MKIKLQFSFFPFILGILGLFIACTALGYFIFSNEGIALMVGAIIVFFYLCFTTLKEITVEKNPKLVKGFLIFIFLLAIGALATLIYVFLFHWIEKLNIYKYLVIIGFIIAAAGTMVPLALDKNKHWFLRSLYGGLLVLIAFVTFSSASNSVEFNNNKTINQDEIELINTALSNYSIENKDKVETIKYKLFLVNETSSLDQFILCMSLILASLTLVYYSDFLQRKAKRNENHL